MVDSNEFFGNKERIVEEIEKELDSTAIKLNGLSLAERPSLLRLLKLIKKIKIGVLK